jgi:uracil-DNA glycosylase family 4
VKIRHRGRADAPVVVVGDAPTRDDATNGQAFSGLQGEVVQDLMHEAGFDPNDVVFVNAISYRKVSTSPFTPNAIREDADQHLIPFINEHPRRLIIVLGNNALCAVGVNTKPEGVNSFRGTVQQSKLTRSTGVSTPTGTWIVDEDTGESHPEIIDETEPIIECPVIVSINPYFILKEPDEADDFLVDLSYGRRVYEGNMHDQVPIHIIDIESPDQIDDLVKDSVGEYSFIAYDHETDSGDRDIAKVVSSSFCNGRKTEDGKYIVWFWGAYDKLKPRFDEQTMREFQMKWDLFYSFAGRPIEDVEDYMDRPEGWGHQYALIAHNSMFDDWVTERVVKHPIRGSNFDTMLMKWQVNNRGRNGLKENTARYLGYPNYDKAVSDIVKGIRDRRGKVLSHPEDFEILKMYGVEPEATELRGGRISYRWSSKLDKLHAAYAMIDYPILREYNAYDAVYTRLLFDLFYDEIKRQKLSKAAHLRHRIAKELMRCEQRGFRMDIDYNRKISKELEDIVESTKRQIEREVLQIEPTLTEFNPNSNKDLAKVLFGDPTLLPVMDRNSVAEAIGDPDIDWFDLGKKLDSFENNFYGDYSNVKEAVKLDAFDIDRVASIMRKEFTKAFNLTADTTLTRIFLHGMYQPIGFTKKGDPSCTSAVLQSLYESSQQPLLSLILLLRKASKIKSTFVDSIYNKLDKNGILHPRMNPIGTETGRISSSAPNSQNFPKGIRGQLIPREGYKFLEWDLSQAEIRAVAAFAGDEELIAALNSHDIHRRIASLVFKKPEDDITDDERRYAKTIVFGIVYGMSSYRLSMAINVSVEEAEEFIAKFFKAFPGLKKWLDNQVRQAMRSPHKAKTPWGTQRSVRNILSVDKKVRSHAERIAKNMPIQGAAGELTLYYICEIMDEVRAQGWDVHLVNTTHDSCTLEVPENLVWTIPVFAEDGTQKKNKKGEPLDKPAGPVVDLIQKVINTPAPVEPLNRVNFVADIELNSYWSAKPDIYKAIDPKYGTDASKMRWDLIRTDVLEREEEEELAEVEAVMLGV